MAKRKNIAHILLSRIDAAHQQGRGHSKRADRQNGSAPNRLYSDITAHNYAAICKRFARWVRTEHPEAWKSIDAAQELVPEYLGNIDNPGTRATVANALAKGFGIGTGKAWDVDYGTRHLSQISRGRQLTARAEAWRRNHPVEAEACRCAGLRCLKEAMDLRGNDVIRREDGSVVLRVTGKGGLKREALVWSAPENTVGRDWFLRRAAEVGDSGKIFRDVPDLVNANLHAFRAEYAARMYDYFLRNGAATGELYRPQDGSEVVLDKGVLAAVNTVIGHGDHRACTDWYNYLSYGREA